jgi:hypothetical protein
MRLSEKSIELNFCHQMSTVLGSPVWWFGTTQRQERQAGWDVAGKVAGRWLRFQLKASNEVLSNGVRRFRGHHHQLIELQSRATTPLSVFYVFPTIGTTAELMSANFDLLPRLRLLDVHGLPGGIGAPTTPSGSLRKTELHYFDLHPFTWGLTIRSDPIEAGTLDAPGLGADIGGLMRASEQEQVLDRAGEAAAVSREFLGAGRNRVAAFLPFPQ